MCLLLMLEALTAYAAIQLQQLYFKQPQHNCNTAAIHLQLSLKAASTCPAMYALLHTAS